MSTLTATRPEIISAVAEVRYESEFPLHLEIVSASGQSQIIPMEDGYAVTVDEDTTEGDIFDLEPVLSRIANTFDRVWPF